MRLLCWLILSIALIAAGACASAGDGGPTRRQISLSFDDAPTPGSALLSGEERTARLIEQLRSRGVDGAIFFVRTDRIAGDPAAEARLRRYAAAGHFLANHSDSHRSLRDIGITEFLADIDRASVALQRFEGVAPYMRYPFLHEGRTADDRRIMADALAERGLRNGYVTIDNYDWYLDFLLREAVKDKKSVDWSAMRDLYVGTLLACAEFYDRIGRNALGRSPRHVLLLHENDLAAYFVGDLIDALRRNGWEVIAGPEAYKDPIADYAEDTAFNGQGRLAAIAEKMGADRPSLVHESEDEDYLAAAFARDVLTGR